VDAAHQNLIGLSRGELGSLVQSMGEKPFRARQLWHWIYDRGAADYQAMTPLGKPLRARLAAGFDLVRPEVAREDASADGTIKWLFRFADGSEAETVFIPEVDRGTLCVSSQVGCTLSCTFCHTGTQRLVRNLAVAEIVGQFMAARDALADWPSKRPDRRITNLVMMGMGEPLFNFDNVAKALAIVMDPNGIALSKRRITLSTAGVVPMMRRCGDEIGVKLAVSLHAPDDALRDRLVPINRKYPLDQLMAACRDYPGVHNARRITFEYVMLDGVNDAPEQARALARLVAGIPAKFNLIPFNPWPGAPYRCSSAAAIERFSAILNDAGYTAPARAPRGHDIMAACGQLRTESLHARASLRASGAGGD
jgi:23S rRNA (adenine2503-C2)-methyltransferase